MDAVALKDHALVKFLSEASATIQGFPEDIVSAEPVSELRSQFEYLEWVFDQSDASIVTRQELDALNPIVDQTRQFLGQLITSPSTYANAALTQLQAIFQKFPYPRIRKIPRSESQRIIEAVQQKADESVAVLQGKIDLVQKDSASLSSTINSNLNDLASMKTAISDAEQKLSEQNIQLTNLFSETNSKIESLLSSKLSEGETRQNKIIDEFQIEISKSKVDASNVISDAKRESAELISNQSSEFQSKFGVELNYAKEISAKIQNLYGIVGGEASAGNMIVSANSERTAYWRLFALALIAFVIGSVAAFNIINPILSPGLTLEAMAARLGLTAAMFVPAWYLSSSAGKHRRADLAFRSLALRVAAFDPYMNEFNADVRVSMKQEMANTFFASDLQAENRKSSIFAELRDIDKILTPLEKITDKLKSFVTRTE